jgi:serine/threonine protein kinase
MERYKILKVIGDGTYGTVSKGLALDTGEFVAIKRMKKKFYSWEECLDLREIKCLRRLVHPNIVRLKEVIRSNDDLHLAFEFIERNVVQLLQEGRELPEAEVRDIMQGTLAGIAYCHKVGVFHRDLKPDNLMIGEEVKIIDFGLAREIRSRPPYTDYVSTRWYRAPEILLHATVYSWQVDIFAVGCIMAELYLRRPLFPGTNETDQIAKLCSVLGTPSTSEWPEGYRLASQLGFVFPQFAATPLSALIPRASAEALSLMRDLMQWDPAKRPSAEQCLQHPFFTRTGGIPVAVAPLRHSLTNTESPPRRQLTESPFPGQQFETQSFMRATPVPMSRAQPLQGIPSIAGPREEAGRGRGRGGRTEGIGQYGAGLVGRQAQPLGQIGLGRHRF